MQAPPETTFHHIMEFVQAIGLPAIAVGVGKLIWAAAEQKTVVNTILTNHLPHLDADIKEVKGDVAGIRDAFIEHLQQGKV
jgi:hypothetical protein